MQDLSYVPKFKTGELVAFEGSGLKHIGEVLPSSQFTGGRMMYDVKCDGVTYPVEEKHLRYLTFREFAFHKDTDGNGWMVGKNTLAQAVVIHAFSLCVLLIGGITVQGWAKVAPLLIGTGIIGVFWYGTRGNYTKRIV
jgi:hypothetical protein